MSTMSWAQLYSSPPPDEATTPISGSAIIDPATSTEPADARNPRAPAVAWFVIVATLILARLIWEAAEKE